MHKNNNTYIYNSICISLYIYKIIYIYIEAYYIDYISHRVVYSYTVYSCI